MDRARLGRDDVSEVLAEIGGSAEIDTAVEETLELELFLTEIVPHHFGPS